MTDEDTDADVGADEPAEGRTKVGQDNVSPVSGDSSLLWHLGTVPGSFRLVIYL